jgi:hypothetical protein
VRVPSVYSTPLFGFSPPPLFSHEMSRIKRVRAQRQTHSNLQIELCNELAMVSKHLSSFKGKGEPKSSLELGYTQRKPRSACRDLISRDDASAVSSMSPFHPAFEKTSKEL